MNKRLLILAGLAAVIWLAVYLWPEPSTELPDALGPWPPVSATDVVTLRLQSPAGEFILQRETGEWFLSRVGGMLPPLRAAADKVDGLLNFLRFNPPQRRLHAAEEAPSAEELAQYGLDNPSTVLTMTGESEWTLRLGNPNPAADGIYAQSDTEPGVLLLDKGYVEQLGKFPKHFYDLRVAELHPESVQRLEVAGDQTWAVQRTDAGWAFAAPEALVDEPVALQELDMYLHLLSNLQGQDILTDAVAAPGGRELRFTVSRAADQEPLRIELRELPPQAAPPSEDHAAHLAPATVARYLAATPSLPLPLLLDPKDWERLDKSAFDLRDRRILSLDSAGLESLKLEPAGDTDLRPLLATKSGGRWSDYQGNPLPDMDVLLWRLTDLKFQAPASEALPDSAAEVLRWVLRAADGTDTMVRFHEDPRLPQGQCWVGLENPPRQYPVQRELLDDLLARLATAPPPLGEQAAPDLTTDRPQAPEDTTTPKE